MSYSHYARREQGLVEYRPIEPVQVENVSHGGVPQASKVTTNVKKRGRQSNDNTSGDSSDRYATDKEKGNNSRYGSVESAEKVSALSWLSLRVFLPLEVATVSFSTVFLMPSN